MTDPPRYPDAEPGTGAGPDRGEGMPRWVKVFGIIVALLVVLVAAMILLSGGHGPGRHAQPGAAADQAALSPDATYLSKDDHG